MSSETVETVYGPMPAHLSCAKLQDLCVDAGIQTGPFGSQLHQEDYVQKGTPIITVEHLGENRIAHSNLPQVSDDDKARLSKYVLRTGDIVFSRVGSVDRRALVQPTEDGWLFSGRCLRVRPDARLLDAQWLSYFFGLPAFKDYIRGIAVGATMPSINTKILSDIPIYFPDLVTQREAALTLAQLDDRITLLRETNATLEAIAQALFKSWFVDFDPVRAKVEGRAPEGMDEATAALFPDSFEETELGAVPRGWRVSPIGDLVDTAGGATPDTKNEAFWAPATHHWTSPKDLSGVATPVLLDTERRVSSVGLAKISSGLLPIGTLLMSSRAPIGYLAITQVPVAINQGYIAMPPGGLLPPLFMLFWCKHNIDTIKGRANGSTFMEISKKAFRPIQAIVPTQSVVQAFVDVANALFLRLVENEKQAQTLATIRDTLLPRLINGNVNIN